MPTFSILNVRAYNAPEKITQPCQASYVELLVGGFHHWRTTWPGGRRVAWQNPGPRFVISVPGCVVDFECGTDRENWVVQLQPGDIRYDPATQETELLDGGEWFAIPHVAEVPADRLDYWRRQMERLVRARIGGLPRDRLWSRLTVAEVFRFMLEQQRSAATPHPVTLLKRLIDEDPNHEKPIDALYDACGYSPSRLRDLFRQAYHLSPRDYRNQRRMGRVMDLIATSRLGVKEIARATGFKYVSHISAAFRREQGITLREAIRRYRR